MVGAEAMARQQVSAEIWVDLSYQQIFPLNLKLPLIFLPPYSTPNMIYLLVTYC